MYHKALKFIEKIGFFRLTLIPMGICIILSAIEHHIWGMGIIGTMVLVFGFFNKCLLLGTCDVDVSKENQSGSQ